ncbi:hypothetical protein BDR04DRAFT_563928 [Suillus decipiens]|nr:hypothetical protein BDR04DRAFT_563928 [Suillus decipiens]
MSQTNCIEAVKEAVQANKDHQHALKVYTERLEAELQTVDKLLETADANLDGEPDIDVGGSILIPGSVKASGLLAPSELLSEDSPFYEEAAQRSRYISLTEVHPMTKKDLETLREAVRTENYRMHALDAQRNLSNQPSNYLELNKEGLDWDRIAEKVSSSSMYPRTPRECEIRWLGDQHPCFNRDPWTQDEVTKLKRLAAEYGNEQVDWEAVVDKLGTHRTPLDCMIHGTTRKNHLWTPDSDERLLKAVATFGHDNWCVVARKVSEDATPSQCQNRYQRTLDPTLRHKTWSNEEDSRLRLAVQAHGTSWVNVASAIPGRHNDQCRDRWNDILDPALTKGRWTEEEDRDLLALVQQLGTSSWKEISNRLDSSRTDSMCRNRYNNLQRPKTSKPPKTQSQTASFSVIAQPSMDMIAESSRKGKASIPANEFSDVNEFASIEESSSVPRIPGIHVTTRTADSAIMFLDPVINVNPETHKKRTREVLGMAKGKSLEKAKTNSTDPDAGTTPEGTSDPSTSTKKVGRKKKARVETASEEMSAKKAPRPRARPVRSKKNAAPGTMVLDLGPPYVSAGGNSETIDQTGPSILNPGGPGLVVQCCHVSELGLRPPSPSNRMG